MSAERPRAAASRESTPPPPPWLSTAAAVAGRLLVAAAAVLALAFALSRLYLAFLPLFVALLLSTLLVPPARWLKQRGVPAALAALISVVGAVVVITGALALLVPQVVSQLEELTSDVDLGLETLVDGAAETLGIPLPESEASALVDRAIEQLRDNAGRIGAGVLSGAIIVIEVVTGLVLALVLTFFFAKDGERITGWFVDRSPPAHRETLEAVARRAWNTLAGYVRGQTIIAAVDAVGIGLGLLLLGVPLALPLTVLTFFGGFIPIVGAFTAGLLAVLVALVNGGLTDALFVLALVVGVQQTEGNVLEPLVLGRTVPLHPVVILLVITAGAVLGGVIGAFLAVPVAAVVSAVANELRVRHEEQEVRP